MPEACDGGDALVPWVNKMRSIREARGQTFFFRTENV
jgi:hypothetical protein